MYLKSSALLMRSLVVVACIAAASVPTVDNHDAGAATISNQARTDHRLPHRLLLRKDAASTAAATDGWLQLTTSLVL